MSPINLNKISHCLGEYIIKSNILGILKEKGVLRNMKKWAIVLLIVLCFVFVGCSNDGDVSSLSEYEMVEIEFIKNKTSA